MNIDHLRYFTVTARHGNLAQASRLLHVTPSTLSHAIDKLGGELGGELFERAGRGLSLTARGQALLPKAEALLEQADQLKRDLEGKAPRLSLRLAAPASLMGVVLAPCLALEARRRSNVGYVLSQPSSPECLRALKEGKIDVALVFSEDKGVPEHARKLHSDQLYLCVRPDHPLVRVPDNRRVEMLHHYPLAAPQPYEALIASADPSFKKLLKRQGEVVFQYPSYEICARLMREMDAWSFVPGWVLKSFQRDLVGLVASPICRGVDVVLHWHPKRCPPSFSEELARELQAFFAH